MTQLSRRAFLKKAGAVAWFGPGSIAAISSYIPAAQEIAGRVFTQTDVYKQPALSSATCGQLLPDSLTPIKAVSRSGEWYQVSGENVRGYVPCEALQPVLPYSPPDLVGEIGSGFWAEVVAPISMIREYCAAQAPILARLGFGAVLYVMDRMIDSHQQVWYGVTDMPGSPLIGWGTALHYACWQPESTKHESLHVVIRRRELTVYDRARAISRTLIYAPPLSPTRTVLKAIQPGAAIDTATPLGLPFLMQLDSGQRLHGAFWHNRFGAIREDSSSAIEISTFAARWLYGQLVGYDKPVVLMIE